MRFHLICDCAPHNLGVGSSSKDCYFGSKPTYATHNQVPRIRLHTGLCFSEEGLLVHVSDGRYSIQCIEASWIWQKLPTDESVEQLGLAY